MNQSAEPIEFMVCCAGRFPLCFNQPMSTGMAVLQSQCACEVARKAVADMPSTPKVTIKKD